MKILFTGGGTGGHIFPIVAISRQLRKSYLGENLRIFFIGPKGEIPPIFFTQEGIKVKTILAGKIRRYFGIKSLLLNLFDILFKIPIGIIQAFFYIFFLSPDLIFSKGGYGSLPAVISGRLLGTPIFLHESDISPGFANRVLSRFSLEVFVSFPTRATAKGGDTAAASSTVRKTEYFPPEKMLSVGNPIREEILGGDQEMAKDLFKLTGQKPVILILGGSQGSQRINDMLLQILPELLIDFELIHQCGQKNFKEIAAESKVVIDKNLEKHYHLSPFLNEIELSHAFQAADFIVSRAGSGSIFEISAVAKPAILIPLPEAAQGHQVKNAYSYAENGACLVIEEANLTPHFFLDRLKYLFFHSGELEKMKKAAKDFARPRAAQVIAEYLLAYLT